MGSIGGYVALVLVAIEVTLIIFFALGKVSKGSFAIASLPLVFLAGFFWMGGRITEMTIAGIGTIKTAVDVATQYVQDIKQIKAEVEQQKGAVNAVAKAAQTTDQAINDLKQKNEQATAQLSKIAEQLAQARKLTDQLQKEQEYANVARYDSTGLLGLAGAGLKESSPLNYVLSPFVHNDPNNFHWDCTPEAIAAYTKAIQLESRFPFSYFYRAECKAGNWQSDLETARDILMITTQIPGHNVNHDEILRFIEMGKVR